MQKYIITFALFYSLLLGAVGTALAEDQPVVLCNQTTGVSHLIAAIWDIESIGDGIATKVSFEGTYHENETAARVTGLFFDETLNPFRELTIDVVYVGPNACSWTFDGVKNNGSDEYIGTWTHTAPQNCGGSGTYSFIWGLCPGILPLESL